MQTALEIGASVPRIVLGRYELLGKLGTGGMASVYLARHAGEAGFQRLCAIKVLHPHLTEEVGFIAMLLDEARIAARLHHPNVVSIIDLNAHESTLYVAMDYIEGCSLAALLRKLRDERPPRLLVPLVLDMLAGLHEAHSCTDDDGAPLNLVHRDVSPQNVLVGIDGTARITDFGIARAGSRITSTQPGQLKGKLAYMSPEQVRSGPIDRRSDVFSAGTMLWCMLTGRKLFVGDNDAATMNNIMALNIPPPSKIGFAPPAALDAVCLKALQRDPDKRFATAQDMEEALRDAASARNLIGSRREISDWIAASFRDELAERRKAIRASAAPGGLPVHGSPPALGRAMTESPSFTPSQFTSAPPADLAASSPGVASEPTRLRASAASPTARRIRWRAILSGLAVVAAIVAAFALGRSEEPAVLALPPRRPTAPVARTVSTPAVARTLPVGPVAPGPAASPANAPAAAPAEAAQVAAPASLDAPARAPAPPPHPRRVVKVAPRPPAPVAVSPASPPTPPAPQPSPQPPPRPTRWDSDSPTPPP